MFFPSMNCCIFLPLSYVCNSALVFSVCSSVFVVAEHFVAAGVYLGCTIYFPKYSKATSVSVKTLYVFISKSSFAMDTLA